MFLQYVTDPRYGWPAECTERFGVTPTQVLHEWNTIVHVGEYEGDPRRRPLTYDEVQALFDAADGIVDGIRSRGRKGVLGAIRDAALLKTIYAYGLRRREGTVTLIEMCSGSVGFVALVVDQRWVVWHFRRQSRARRPDSRPRSDQPFRFAIGSR